MATTTEVWVETITGLTPDPRRSGSVRIEVGGRPLLTVAAEVAVREGLREGLLLDEALHQRLCRAADAEAALRAGLRALERRAWARQELGRRLVQRGHPPDGVDEAVERLTRLGLLDDRAFAARFVESRRARGFGPVRLRHDLAGRGVEPELIDEVLQAELPDGEAADDAFRTLARQRLARLTGLPRTARLRRLLAYLGRRGFTGSRYRRIAREELDRAE